MFKKRGFTLVELLAVIVLLGVLTTVSVAAVLQTRKRNNYELAKSLETSLTSVGDDIYVYETLMQNSTPGFFNSEFKSLSEGETLIISLTELKEAGYIKNVRSGAFISPEGGDKSCDGYLKVTKESNSPIFKGFVKCDALYVTPDYNNTEHNTSSVKLTNKGEETTSTAAPYWTD